jgi:large subunit ribosomal protein L4
MKADTYNLKNEKIGTIELSERVFGAKWNAVLVKQVLDAQVANERDPWAHVRDRSEVRGGGKKPWRQKGTGRARHGSTRSPLWRHGGKAHGPRNDKDYSQKVNKKMKQGAFFSALSKKFKDGEVKFFENFALETPKTKLLAVSLRGLLAMPKTSKRYDVLIVADAKDKSVFRASSNLQKAKTVEATSINVYDILNHKNIFIDKDAVGIIAKHYVASEK